MLALLGLLGLAHLGLCDCTGANVVTLPYRNVTVMGASQIRGVPLSLGTPPRTLAFDLAGFSNNTFLWEDSHGCGNKVEYDNPCIYNRGGIFWTNMSSTWSDVASANVTANDTTISQFNFTGTPPRGADILHINNSYSLYDFPVATTGQGIRLNSIGLGPNSTLLQYLFDTGAIISKTWSLFYGKAGSTEGTQMNGVAVLGGYDKAKTQGNNQTFNVRFDMNCRTGLVALVSSIDVGYENGTTENAYPAPLNMCLDPSVPIMTFTSDIVKSLKTKFGGTSFGTSTGTAFNGLLYPSSQAFSGNLSITLNNNLTITIPNDQLVLPDHYIKQTEYLFSQDSREILVGTSAGNDQVNAMPYLGQPFFTAAYLMVNQDEQKFSIWENKAVDSEDYQAIQSDGTVCKAAVPSPTASAQATKDSTGLSGGAIAGIVVGVVAFVALVGALAATIIYQKKKAQKQNALDDGYGNSGNRYSSASPRRPPVEVPANQPNPRMVHELPVAYPGEK